MDQEGKTDGIQDRASHIQVNVEELVKALNERCKTYGLRAKPTTLLELPFGWQPGIQEGAADWDEEWDKFADEGFTFVKELTLDVKNVIAPPKPKSSLVREKASSLGEHDTGKSSADVDTGSKIGKLPSHGQAREASDGEFSHGDQQAERSPTDSSARKNAVESPSKEFKESMHGKDAAFDGSPNAAQRKDISLDGSPHAAQREHGGLLNLCFQGTTVLMNLAGVRLIPTLILMLHGTKALLQRAWIRTIVTNLLFSMLMTGG